MVPLSQDSEVGSSVRMVCGASWRSLGKCVEMRGSDASTTFSWQALTLSESSGFPVRGATGPSSTFCSVCAWPGGLPGRRPETRGEKRIRCTWLRPEKTWNMRRRPTLRLCQPRAGREWHELHPFPGWPLHGAWLGKLYCVKYYVRGFRADIVMQCGRRSVVAW